MHGFRSITTSTFDALVPTLLGAALLVSCSLLAWHTLAGGQFEVHVVGELLLVAVLSLEGVIAVRHLRQARLDSLHQVLMAARRDYGSAEMMLALVTLWRFRQQHGDQFVQVYLDTWRRDEERIALLPPSEQVAAVRGTLHFHRRLVKEFYNSLAGLYELHVLPKEMLCTYWSEAELRIIPEILIPLETAVAHGLRAERDVDGWLQRLRTLYDDACVGKSPAA
jgi:hypothetical protein